VFDWVKLMLMMPFRARVAMNLNESLRNSKGGRKRFKKHQVRMAGMEDLSRTVIRF
jgi:hypothetical protein